MNTYSDPYFTPATLEGFQGYHLQVFASGRAKITLQHDGKRQVEYYADRPKRDREAYCRQKKRSAAILPEHFRVVDRLLDASRAAYVYRVHAKGDNNKTADNAHLVVSEYASTIWVVMGTIIHEWKVEDRVAAKLITGGGARKGAASIFHEFVPTFEHDWQDATFDETMYKQGYRNQTRTQQNSAVPEIISNTDAALTPLHSRASASLSPLVSPQEVVRGPQSASPRRQMHFEYPDGSLSEPYDEEPDPEDWGMFDNLAEDSFEACDMVVFGREDRVATIFAKKSVGRPPNLTPAKTRKPYSTTELWDLIKNDNIQ